MQGNEESRASRIQFNHFDVVPEAKDHYFSSSAVKKCFSNENSPVYAKIMKEWKILEKNLPQDIYVQVYETRIDLLRAVIIGASGTPYHDGLFFFDILLPSNYPREPPSVYYHSHGYHLNPNLYDNGTVCLSLINTWHGDKTERWTIESSILQVLVSIQGLVLNEKPFFNEPGRSMSQWFERASYAYNEDVFILSCKTMLHIMKKPPENFEDFVAEHFRSRAASILAAIQDYQKGNMLVGQFQMFNSSSGFKASNAFRTNLNRILSELKTAFDSVISEAGMEEIEKKENEEASSSSSKTQRTVKKWKLLKYASSKRKTKENVEKKKDGIWNRIISYAKRILK
ncbi:Ubiquitin-protein ligase [Handroanthus impetiginosus]|uniref:Ubiquitin-protein ligase n=1 Tax=Handroanthus impetiginosus TaxID=429701 RepID=A0A2G9I0H8_9LAMI|nr:Ubiquitin-protein ligase [Handroanthus impetiginosus]